MLPLLSLLCGLAFAQDPAPAPAPPPPSPWPKVRLIGQEAAFGAFVIGGGAGFASDGNIDGAGLAALTLLGGAAGTTGGILVARRPGFDTAELHALLGLQELFTFNGVMVGLQTDDERDVGLGILGGAALGSGLGLAWALHDPEPTQALALHSGAFWGLGLTAVGLSYAYAWEGGEPGVFLVLAGGADLGAALGFGLASALPLTENQLRMANAGGFLGAGGALLFVQSSAQIIWYSPHSVAAIVGGAGLVGGTLGLVIATRFDAPRVPVAGSLLQAEGGRVHLALPLPRPMAVPGSRDQTGWGFLLIDQGF